MKNKTVNMKKIVLIGFATSGKSTVGKLLAKKIGAEFVDTDVEIQRQCKLTVQQIFDNFGEEYFRQKENQLLLSLAGKQNIVVACGGGSVLADSFSQFAKDSVVIWLTASATTVKSRLGDIPRPLFDGLTEQQLEDFINSRAPLYERYAKVSVRTDGLTPEQIAEKILF